jgi:hypothetical protein
MARAAYGVALRNFDWAAIGEKQRALYGEAPLGTTQE